MTPARIAAMLLAAIAAGPLAAAAPRAPAPASEAATSLSPAERAALIDRFAKELGDSYVFPDKVAPIIARLRASERAGRFAALAPKALAEAMTADIHAKVQDAHLAIDYSTRPIPAAPANQPPSASEKAERDRFFKALNYGVPKVEILDGNVGYLKIVAFPDAGLTAPVVDAAMSFLGNADALVIDLRGNHGGSPETVALVASYLLPAKTHINDIYFREGNVTKQYWTNGIADSRRLGASVPVYVLTDHRTASGGEELAYDLQQLKRGTLIGEATWGGANPGGSVRLTDHFAAFIPGGRAINPISKTNWEGTGVKPDIAIPGDQALAKALELIKARPVS